MRSLRMAEPRTPFLLKDKPEHLDQKHLTGVCVSGLSQPFASFPPQFGVLPGYS